MVSRVTWGTVTTVLRTLTVELGAVVAPDEVGQGTVKVWTMVNVVDGQTDEAGAGGALEPAGAAVVPVDAVVVLGPVVMVEGTAVMMPGFCLI